MSDLRFALRQLLKNPIFTSAAILCLAPVIGTNTAVVAAEVSTNAVAHRERIDIGGRKLQLEIRGEGSPTVVIEAGMGHPPVKSGSWRKVVDDISRTHRVCIYDRAGLGASDPATKTPRTSEDVAEDLSALLIKAGVPGPYLLVGHSFGGIHARVFADRYPDKILGLVLVDSAHPDMDARWLAALPAATPDEPQSLTKARRFLSSRMTSTANPEQLDVAACAAQVRATRHLGSKPLVILTHSSSFRVDRTLPEEVSLRIEQIAQELQADLKRISDRSTFHQSEKGGHNLPVEDPALVIAGIKEALAAVKHLLQFPAKP